MCQITCNGSIVCEHQVLIEHLRASLTLLFKYAGLHGLEWDLIEKTILHWKCVFELSPRYGRVLN